MAKIHGLVSGEGEPTPHDAHLGRAYGKTTAAMGRARKCGGHGGALSPPVGRYLYDSWAAPHAQLGAVAWGQQKGSAVTRLDALQVVAATRILDTSTQVPHDAARELMGMVRPDHQRQQACARYARHVEAQEPASLLHRVWNAPQPGGEHAVTRPLKETADAAVADWGLDLTESPTTFKANARKAAREASRRTYASGVRTGEQAALLGEVQGEVLGGMAPYLRTLVPDHLARGRALKSKLLLGVSDTAVDTQRRQNVPHDRRCCPMLGCALLVEDARHFVVGCPARRRLVSALRDDIGRAGESRDQFFKRVMSPGFGGRGQEADAAHLYKHLQRCEDTRRRALAPRGGR